MFARRIPIINRHIWADLHVCPYVLYPIFGEVSFRGRTGVLGVSPILFKIPPRVGDNRGLIAFS